MANANSTAIVRKSTEGLKVEEYSWGRSYLGSEDALIASGLIKPEWFPGKPGNPKCTVHLGLIDGEMKIMPYLSMPDHERAEKTVIMLHKQGKRFWVRINCSKEERERRKLKESIEKIHAEENRKLESVAKSPTEFVDSKKSFITPTLGYILSMFRRSENGYHYSSKVAEEARELISDLINLAENGKVYFDQQKQEHFLDEVKKEASASIAKAHPKFSAFMATTLAIGKAALSGEEGI